MLTQTFLVLSLSGNWFSQPSEGKAAETNFSAQLTYVRTWWRLGSSLLSSPVPPCRLSFAFLSAYVVVRSWYYGLYVYSRAYVCSAFRRSSS